VTYVLWAEKYIASETHDRAVAQPVNSADAKAGPLINSLGCNSEALMFALVGGLALALFLYYTTGLTWVLVGAFWTCAILLQVFYTHRLNAFLGGADPVATFGARNLRQLKNTISIPLSVSTLSFFAKVAAWAGVAALLFSVGWFKIDKL